jgi:apolipoprotein N-acyltransferase
VRKGLLFQPGVREIAAVGAGAVLYAGSLPPFDCAVLGWFVLVPLLLVIRDAAPGKAALVGLLYGTLSAWTVGWWFPQAIARYFALGFPVAIAVSMLFAALVWGLTVALFAGASAALFQARPRPAVRYLVPALWVAAELFRSRLIGSPWGLLGHTQHMHVGLIQVVAITGVYGLSFVLALVNVAIAEAIALPRSSWRVRTWFAIAFVPAVCVLATWSVGGLVALHGPAGGFSAARVAVVQPNVAPAFEWSRAYTDRQIRAHVAASDAIDTATKPALIVWSENAVPQHLDADPGLVHELSALARRKRSDLLFGAPRFEDGHTYNAVHLITAAGTDGGHYHKQRLVPLAEAPLLPWSRDEAPSANPTQFSAGRGARLFKSFVTLGVSVCQEAQYPELISDAVQEGAELLVNVSNDGWVDGGYGTASEQHFAMSKFRAVETRRYLVRAAATGVSGIVDPFGRVVASVDAATAGVATAYVAGRSGLTTYVRFGDAFALACVLAGLFALARVRGRVPRGIGSRASGPALGRPSEMPPARI